MLKSSSLWIFIWHDNFITTWKKWQQAMKSKLTNYAGMILLSKNKNRHSSSRCFKNHPTPLETFTVPVCTKEFLYRNNKKGNTESTMFAENVIGLMAYITKKSTKYVKVRERTPGWKWYKLHKTEGWPAKSISWPYFINHLAISQQYAGGRLNKKDGPTRYGDSHVKDKTS